MKRILRSLPLLALAALGHAATATYRVTQDVSSLSLRDSDLFLDFQFTDGAQTGADNSTVRITNLTLTSGSFSFGDRSLADAGLVTGTDTDFTLHNFRGADGSVVSERAVKFRAGSGATLRYDFTVASNSPDAIPDDFVVAMVFHTGSGTGLSDLEFVGTDGPVGLEMVQNTFGGSTSSPTGYAVNQAFAIARAQAGDGRFTGLGTPVIRPVPEPSALAALGLGALGLARRRRAR